MKKYSEFGLLWLMAIRMDNDKTGYYRMHGGWGFGERNKVEIEYLFFICIWYSDCKYCL